MPEESRSPPSGRLDDLAEALLAEDAPGGDLTTEALACMGGAGASNLPRAAR
ncbi:hypothetical protein [Roseiarcus sp.]|uniref:hypothetical protein n=1 Tax=Roseiarcus sp. TaxID=1969460 RepID=UPI003F9A0D3A